jgi:uncharacterized protein (DUF3820 family)
VTEENSGPGSKKNAATDIFMPFGRYKGMLVSQVAEFDLRYAEWLLGQAWFKTRFPSECHEMARAVHQADDPARRQRLHDEFQREVQALFARREQRWLNDHTVKYEPRGIMPFGKYKGYPLTAVARDERYQRWLLASTYSKANPELASDLAAATPPMGELADGGCIVIPFPSARIARRPPHGTPPGNDYRL